MKLLLKKWEKAYLENGITNKLVIDGIVNENQYKNVVWILKETNNFDGAINQLVNEVVTSKRKSGLWKGMTWHNIGRASVKILNPSASFNETEKQKKNSLLNIAIINIKKTTGGATANSKVIQKFAADYQNLIIEQLILLNPKTVVLGGVFHILYTILELERISTTNRYKSNLFKDTIFIKANHPATRKKKRDYFNQFEC